LGRSPRRRIEPHRCTARVGVVFVGEATPADDKRTVPGPMRAFLDRLADHGCGRTR